MSRPILYAGFTWLITVAGVGCTRDLPTDVESSSARLPSTGLDANAVIESVPCPPTVPAGYDFVTCFNFTSIPGVWHGFIMGNAIAPTPPATVGSLSADYLLISPTGLTRIPPNTAVNVGNGEYTFEPEFFNGAWIDVLRFVTPSADPPYELTLAVAKRPLTPAVQAAAIVSQVEQLEAFGALGGGTAAALKDKLADAIVQIESGKPQTAANILRAFANQVRALMSGGNPRLSPAQGQSLIELATGLISRLVD